MSVNRLHKQPVSGGASQPLLGNEPNADYGTYESYSYEDSTTESEDQVTPGRSIPWLVVCLVLVTTALERITYYSLQSNMVDILSRLGIAQSSDVFWFLATSQFLPIVGALLAENRFGTFPTAAFGLVLETLGICLLLGLIPLLSNQDFFTMADIEPTPQPSNVLGPGGECLLIFGLCLTAIGVGFNHANLLVLAAKQLPDDRIVPTCIFLWYYWLGNIGAFLGHLTVLASTPLTMAMWLAPLVIGICLVSMLPVLKYERDVPSTRISRVFLDSVKQMFGLLSTALPHSASQDLRNRMERRLQYLPLFRRHVRRMAFLIGITVMFSTIYSIEISWVAIVHQMHFPNSTTTQDTYWVVSLYDPGSIIVLAPIAYFVILPVMRKCCPSCLKQLRLMGFGMVLGAISLLIASVVETVRHFGGEHLMGIYWQIPHLALMGLAEIFTFVVGYEFAYMEAPKGIRNTMVGFFFCSTGLGYYIGVAIMYSLGLAGNVHSMDRSEVDNVHVYVVLYCLSAVQLLVAMLFMCLAHGYKYQSDMDPGLDEIIRHADIFASIGWGH